MRKAAEVFRPIKLKEAGFSDQLQSDLDMGTISNPPKYSFGSFANPFDPLRFFQAAGDSSVGSEMTGSYFDLRATLLDFFSFK